MNLLLSGVQIIDPGSSLNNQVVDIHVSKSRIQKIGKNLSVSGAKSLDLKGCCISPGFFDMLASTGDPGLEHKEDMKTVCAAAAVGGFTDIASMPNTSPPVHSRTEVDYIISKNRDFTVQIHPLGTVSHERAGQVITEIYDMNAGGAVAFTDADAPISDEGLLLKALQYVKPFKGLIIDLPQNMQLIPHGQMHEGAMSTLLGMPGIPAVAEEMMVMRGLKLLEYSESRLHFANISCAHSVDLIRAAKRKGLAVTASVAAYQLLLDDSYLESYDSNYKVNPPLRTKADIQSLKKGLKDGVIDVINSNHIPHEIESKKCEFEMAEFGMSCLESTYACAQTALAGYMDQEAIINCLSHNPRKILGIEIPHITEGAEAAFTVYDPGEKWVFNLKDIRSRGKNNPFPGMTFLGKVKGIFNRGKWVSA